jgi:hypothetical protein
MQLFYGEAQKRVLMRAIVVIQPNEEKVWLEGVNSFLHFCIGGDIKLCAAPNHRKIKAVERLSLLIGGLWLGVAVLLLCSSVVHAHH